jgi:NAD(P)-dependent dehydrogenase (short-subunit alcohol dehydrogenase family)
MTLPFGAEGFTEADIPRQKGKSFLITGGNSGVGFEAARLLGRAGADVCILCRNARKADAAIEKLRAAAPDARFTSMPLDLSKLDSVRDCIRMIRGRYDRVDGLINNAGVMAIPKRQLTDNGFEQQFAVNVLGHFALSAGLSDLVERAGGRFVTLSSIAHRYAKQIPFDDLTYENGYSPFKAYGVSKLADLMFALELQRRLAHAGKTATSYACHPGYSDTNLVSSGPGRIASVLALPLKAMFAQPAEKGALPVLLAATSPHAEPGGYYGPTGFQEMNGPVGQAEIKPWAQNREAAVMLWDRATELTGARWRIFEQV